MDFFAGQSESGSGRGPASTHENREAFTLPAKKDLPDCWEDPLVLSGLRRAGLVMEDKIYRLRLARVHGHFLRESAQLFMPSFYGVFPGRKITEIKASVFVGNRKVGMLENRDIAAHPGMHVTFHRNRDLLAYETLF